MNIKNQKDAFLAYEANNYFLRNKAVKYTASDDVVIKILQDYNVTPKNVLEIGCNTGYRLNAIRSNFQDVQVTGVEPSSDAISKGKELYPEINFCKGTADDMSFLKAGSFDVVIIGFVLYVVDRELLLNVVAETDRVLQNGGILIIVDFFSEKPVRNPYKHIEDIEAFAFKQNYDQIFTASNLYHLLDKRSLDHTTRQCDLSNNFYDKYSVSTLKKDLVQGYK